MLPGPFSKTTRQRKLDFGTKYQQKRKRLPWWSFVASIPIRRGLAGGGGIIDDRTPRVGVEHECSHLSRGGDSTVSIFGERLGSFSTGRLYIVRLGESYIEGRRLRTGLLQVCGCGDLFSLSSENATVAFRRCNRAVCCV